MLLKLGQLGFRSSSNHAFLPSDITNLALWLDASDAGTIIHTAGAVSQWSDKSGNSNHATQGTGTKQPTTGAGNINGRNILQFNKDNMTGSASIGAGKTIFITARRPSPFTGNQALIELYNGDRFASYIRNNGSIAAYDGEAAYEDIFPSGTITAENAFILAIRLSGTTLNIWHNGAAGTPIDIGNENATTSYIIGDDSTGSDDDLIDYGEIITYDTAITDGDINQVGNYLSSKWGISWANI